VCVSLHFSSVTQTFAAIHIITHTHTPLLDALKLCSAAQQKKEQNSKNQKFTSLLCGFLCCKFSSLLVTLPLFSYETRN